MLKTEERNENSKNIDKMTSLEMMHVMQKENVNAALAVEDQLESIAEAVDKISERMKKGGRLFYIGCGTSGRLGVVDASECPPTFGVTRDTVIGIIAGGYTALYDASEGAEDNFDAGMNDVSVYNLTENDTAVKGELLLKTGENRFVDKKLWNDFLDFCEKRLDEVISKDT